MALIEKYMGSYKNWTIKKCKLFRYVRNTDVKRSAMRVHPMNEVGFSGSRVEKTWEKVNVSFGKIFRSALPLLSIITRHVLLR